MLRTMWITGLAMLLIKALPHERGAPQLAAVICDYLALRMRKHGALDSARQFDDLAEDFRSDWLYKRVKD